MINRKNFFKFILGGLGLISLSSLFSFFKRNSYSSNVVCNNELPPNQTNQGYLFPSFGNDNVGAGPGLITHSPYGSMVHPPAGLTRTTLSRFENPFSIPREVNTQYLPSFSVLPSIKTYEIHSIERPINVAHKTIFYAWTFNGMLPGPIIRARLGEKIRIKFKNMSKDPHSIHFHGSHSVSMDGWEPIPPGKETEYIIEAKPIGVHPYHCHVPPIAVHLSKGLFGTMIVDPPEGRPPAHEVVLILHGYDLNGRGKNDIYCWNGIAGYYERFPIRVKFGELVRVYLINMLEYDPIASFHLHAQTFDVYRTGSKLTPDEHTDVVTLGQTERCIIEFRLPEKGRYMFHPHQTYMAERGAMGWFVAI
jgi:FtsP/CotA-like multicopper oxidase with cupredoxin domain